MRNTSYLQRKSFVILAGLATASACAFDITPECFDIGPKKVFTNADCTEHYTCTQNVTVKLYPGDDWISAINGGQQTRTCTKCNAYLDVFGDCVPGTNCLTGTFIITRPIGQTPCDGGMCCQ